MGIFLGKKKELFRVSVDNYREVQRLESFLYRWLSDIFRELIDFDSLVFVGYISYRSMVLYG